MFNLEVLHPAQSYPCRQTWNCGHPPTWQQDATQQCCLSNSFHSEAISGLEGQMVKGKSIQPSSHHTETQRNILNWKHDPPGTIPERKVKGRAFGRQISRVHGNADLSQTFRPRPTPGKAHSVCFHNALPSGPSPSELSEDRQEEAKHYQLTLNVVQGSRKSLTLQNRCIVKSK